MLPCIRYYVRQGLKVKILQRHQYNHNKVLVIRNQKLNSTVVMSAKNVAGFSRQRTSITKGTLKMLETLIEEKSIDEMNPEKWQEIQESCEHRLANKGLFFSSVMKLCEKSDNVAVADSLMCYIKECNVKLDLPTLAYYICLYGRQCELQGDSSLEARVLELYDQLVADYGVYWPPTVGHLVIQGLSHTSKWRECLELMQNIIYSKYRAPVSCYHNIARAAFRNDEPNLAWDVLNSLTGSTDHIYTSTHLYLINRCRDMIESDRQDTFNEELEKYLTLASQFQLLIPEQAVIEFRSCMESIPWSEWRCRFTTVKPNGRCFSCSQQLPRRISLTDEEFIQLKQVLERRVFEGEQVWMRTTPLEFKKFTKIIESSQKYDFVIDGLNVSYANAFTSAVTNMKPTHILQYNLYSVVKSLILRHGQKVRILLLGKNHMSRWGLKELLGEFGGQVEVFLTDKYSKDDLYLLYAAFHSGRDCLVVSGDYFRDAQHLMSPVYSLFAQWRYRHQMRVRSIYSTNNRVTFYPLVYTNPVPQWTRTSIHIPYQISQDEQENYEFPKHWLCANKF